MSKQPLSPTLLHDCCMIQAVLTCTVYAFSRTTVQSGQPSVKWTKHCWIEKKMSHFSNFRRGSNRQTWLVSFEIVFSVSRFEPALNWNRFLAVQRLNYWFFNRIDKQSIQWIIYWVLLRNSGWNFRAFYNMLKTTVCIIY